jgi:hypothetical protein
MYCNYARQKNSGMLILSVAVLAGRGRMGADVEREGFKMGQLTLGKRPARMGIATTYEDLPFQVRGFLA